jgi:hypothetical protein
MAMPADKGRDVIRRTMTNYDFVKAHTTDGVFEVTQLVNSFLCALIQPWAQHNKQTAPWNLSLIDAEARGWPHVSSTVGNTATLGDLIIEMRNALAHGHVEYLASPKGADISGLRLTTKQPPLYAGVKWQGELSVSDLEQFLTRFAAIAAA